jgi:hypothetical protein
LRNPRQQSYFNHFFQNSTYISTTVSQSSLGSEFCTELGYVVEYSAMLCLNMATLELKAKFEIGHNYKQLLPTKFYFPFDL